MRPIDGNALIELINGGYDLDFDEVPETKRELLRMIMEQPTVEAIPISFIEKRIEQLKSHADYEFEANGGYAGGSQYRQWELECLLDAWTKRKDNG